MPGESREFNCTTIAAAASNSVNSGICSSCTVISRDAILVHPVILWWLAELRQRREVSTLAALARGRSELVDGDPLVPARETRHARSQPRLRIHRAVQCRNLRRLISQYHQIDSPSSVSSSSISHASHSSSISVRLPVQLAPAHGVQQLRAEGIGRCLLLGRHLRDLILAVPVVAEPLFFTDAELLPRESRLRLRQ